MCTCVAVGREATTEGVILISRNEDAERCNWNKYMVYRAEPEYVKNKGIVVDGDFWTLGNGLEVEVPANAFRYSGMPDAGAFEEATSAIGARFFFEERGINERNFAISATNSFQMNRRAESADPLLKSGGIAEAIIPTLLLPQAESARHAVELLGSYLENNGASEANGVMLADPDEAWYFENGSSHHWIAVRIPPDSYLIAANGMRVHSVDLDDRDNVMCSEGIYDFVVSHDLLEKPDRQCFNFAQAFGIPGVPYNVDRIWLAQSILSPSRRQKPRQHQYPLFLKPDELVGVGDVMGVLTATYEGTVLEGKAERPIGWPRTAESHIITFNSRLPDELCGLIWQAVSTPLCSPFLPLYRVMHVVPQCYALGNDDYGTMSAYWAFRGLYALANEHKDTFLPEVTELWKTYERGFLEENPFLEKMLVEMYAVDPTPAIDFAGRYSTGIAYDAVAKANLERNKLMTRITVESRPAPHDQ
ncbi:MAG: C69 family dipeptidase [bacterium]|nr:C69 family dipeptidase [bacterium]